MVPVERKRIDNTSVVYSDAILEEKPPKCDTFIVSEDRKNVLSLYLTQFCIDHQSSIQLDLHIYVHVIL